MQPTAKSGGTSRDPRTRHGADGKVLHGAPLADPMRQGAPSPFLMGSLRFAVSATCLGSLRFACPRARDRLVRRRACDLPRCAPPALALLLHSPARTDPSTRAPPSLHGDRLRQVARL